MLHFASAKHAKLIVDAWPRNAEVNMSDINHNEGKHLPLDRETKDLFMELIDRTGETDRLLLTLIASNDE